MLGEQAHSRKTIAMRVSPSARDKAFFFFLNEKTVRDWGSQRRGGSKSLVEEGLRQQPGAKTLARHLV